MEIMRLSQQYAPTLKEDPADAEIASHRLLVRAGMIRKVAGGVYTFLPLGMRVLTTVSYTHLPLPRKPTFTVPDLQASQQC